MIAPGELAGSPLSSFHWGPGQGSVFSDGHLKEQNTLPKRAHRAAALLKRMVGERGQLIGFQGLFLVAESENVEMPSFT